MPYISETVHPSIRATLMTMPGFMIAAGMLLVWTLGYFLTWRIIAHLLVIPPILLILSILPLPETPYWLIENNQVIKARKSLQFFRGKEYDETGEFDEIKENMNQSKNLTKIIHGDSLLNESCPLPFWSRMVDLEYCTWSILGVVSVKYKSSWLKFSRNLVLVLIQR